MQTSTPKLTGIIQHTRSETVYWLLSAMAFGVIQATLVSLAFFSGPSIELAKTFAERDKVIALAILEKCEVFSAVGATYRPNGTLGIECTLDLKYFDKLERMRRILRRQKAKSKSAL